MSPMTTKERLISFFYTYVTCLMISDDDTTFHFKLDDDLAIFLGWGGGFDDKDSETDYNFIHSKKDATYCICTKIAKYNPCDLTWDGAYMPWYTDDGEAYDTETALFVKQQDGEYLVSPNEDYEQIADWLLKDYEEIRKLLNDGKLTL